MKICYTPLNLTLTWHIDVSTIEQLKNSQDIYGRIKEKLQSNAHAKEKLEPKGTVKKRNLMKQTKRCDAIFVACAIIRRKAALNEKKARNAINAVSSDKLRTVIRAPFRTIHMKQENAKKEKQKYTRNWNRVRYNAFQLEREIWKWNGTLMRKDRHRRNIEGVGNAITKVIGTFEENRMINPEAYKLELLWCRPTRFYTRY